MWRELLLLLKTFRGDIQPNMGLKTSVRVRHKKVFSVDL